MVSAEVLRLSCNINDLAFANSLSGALFGKGNFPNSLTTGTISHHSGVGRERGLIVYDRSHLAVRGCGCTSAYRKYHPRKLVSTDPPVTTPTWETGPMHAKQKPGSADNATPIWHALALKSVKGKPLPVVENAFLALKHDPDVCDAFAFDEMANTLVMLHEVVDPSRRCEPPGEVNAAELRDMIMKYNPTLAIIEPVGSMPRDGVRQAWRFSAAYTTARNVVALFNIPVDLVTPSNWKRSMQVAGGVGGKEQCRAKAVQLFPACAASFARKKDAGRAEAAPLARYGVAAFYNQQRGAA
jgi:hypothetical protein